MGIRRYAFRLDGRLSDRAQTAFENIRITEAPPQAIIDGEMLDESHLQGIIGQFKARGSPWCRHIPSPTPRARPRLTADVAVEGRAGFPPRTQSRTGCQRSTAAAPCSDAIRSPNSATLEASSTARSWSLWAAPNRPTPATIPRRWPRRPRPCDRLNSHDHLMHDRTWTVHVIRSILRRPGTCKGDTRGSGAIASNGAPIGAEGVYQRGRGRDRATAVTRRGGCRRSCSASA